MACASVPQDPSSSPPRLTVVGAHVAAATVVLAGVVVVLWRPAGPELQATLSPTAWFDLDQLQQVRAYRDPRYVAGVGAIAVRLVVVGVVAASPAGRRLVERVVRRVGPRRPARAAAAVVLGTVAASDLAVLPIAFWVGYVHEGTFGFRTQGIGGWLADWSVVTLLGWIVTGVVVLGGYTLAGRLHVAWPPVAGLAGATLTVAVVFAAPLLFEPLILDTEPLPAGALREDIEALLRRADVSGTPILVGDASRRTTKRNAYVSGLGASRRVVLYDTLLDAQPPEEVAVVVAHELAHDRNADLLRGTVIAAAAVVVTVYLLAGVVRWRTRRGQQDAPADPRAAAVVLAVVVVLQVAAAPVQNALSRRAEAAADLGALQLSRSPDAYLRMTHELTRANLSDPAPPWWARALFSTHPPPHVRLELGLRYAEGLIGEHES